jgi:hypothetical protein
MGNSQSETLPTRVLDCSEAEASNRQHDAMFDYQCTSDQQVRTGLALLHLLIIVAVFTVTVS